jgi:hypothetical protein
MSGKSLWLGPFLSVEKVATGAGWLHAIAYNE